MSTCGFRGIVSAAWADVLALRPVFALTAVWLTTAGHTLYFREMYSAFGWVRQVGLSLHSMYLLSIALTLARRAAAGSVDRQLRAGHRRPGFAVCRLDR